MNNKTLYIITILFFITSCNSNEKNELIVLYKKLNSIEHDFFCCEKVENNKEAQQAIQNIKRVRKKVFDNLHPMDNLELEGLIKTSETIHVSGIKYSIRVSTKVNNYKIESEHPFNKVKVTNLYDLTFVSKTDPCCSKMLGQDNRYVSIENSFLWENNRLEEKYKNIYYW